MRFVCTVGSEIEDTNIINPIPWSGQGCCSLEIIAMVSLMAKYESLMTPASAQIATKMYPNPPDDVRWPPIAH